MSGPKVSVYELSAAQKKRYYEQLEILKQTESCLQKILRSMNTLVNEIEKVENLINQGTQRCNALGRDVDFSEIAIKIEELRSDIGKMNAEYLRIQAEYRKDKAGFVKLSDEMDHERAAKLKALQTLSDQIGEEIKSSKSLKQETLDAIEAFDEELRNELHSQMLGGFAIDFSNIKRKEEKSTVNNSQDDETIKATEEKRLYYVKKINTALETVADMFGSAEKLSDGLKAKQNQIKQLAAEITSVDYLENFYAITVTPFVRECREYAEIFKRYDEIYMRYQTLCEENGLIPLKYECSEENILAINTEIEKLEAENANEMVREYIDDALEEAMEEMGYGLVGRREAVKKSGRKIKHELYQFGEGTGVDITYGVNGQITMELGGFDTKDRVPDANEANKLTEDMHRFCGEYVALERLLEKKGVCRRNISLMPPSAEFAQIFNIEDYEMSKSVENFEAKKDKKVESKAKHAE